MKQVKIFIASPDDLVDERKLFVDIIDSTNRSRAHKEGIHLEAITWEKYAYPEADNPQVVINKLLTDAELLIVTFWNKFGAPTKAFPSGTMEEFSTAFEKRKAAGLPSIKIYFRKPTPPESVASLKELQKVLSFKESIHDSAMYKEYSSAEQFKDLLHEHINAWLTELVNKPPEPATVVSDIARRKLTQPADTKSLIGAYFQKIEEKYENPQKRKILFGLERLDNAIGDIDDNNLILIAGTESSGKTSLALTLSNNTSLLQTSILFFSLKSKKTEIIHRFVCSQAKIKSYLLRSGYIEERDWTPISLV